MMAVRVHHHSLWQVEVPQLPQESHHVLALRELMFLCHLRSWVMTVPVKFEDWGWCRGGLVLSVVHSHPPCLKALSFKLFGLH